MRRTSHRMFPFTKTKMATAREQIEYSPRKASNGWLSAQDRVLANLTHTQHLLEHNSED